MASSLGRKTWLYTSLWTSYRDHLVRLRTSHSVDDGLVPWEEDVAVHELMDKLQGSSGDLRTSPSVDDGLVHERKKWLYMSLRTSYRDHLVRLRTSHSVDDGLVP